MIKKVYVASSWRNKQQPSVVKGLRGAGYEVYDFRQPVDGDNGFHWSDIDPAWELWSPAEFAARLGHPIALEGFSRDMKALDDAGAVVLVLPCGRSAHLEFGYAVSRGAYGIILLADGEPELMYLMADVLCGSINEVVRALKETRGQ